MMNKNKQTETDAIYNALVQGDASCPDGDALVRIGQLVRRETAPAPVDLRQSVFAGIQDLRVQQDENSSSVESDIADPLIDDFYNGNAAASAADPALGRLGDLVRTHTEPPVSIDLLPDLTHKLSGLKRRRSSARQQGIERSTRWRIWTSVIVGHVAALVITVLLFEDMHLAAQQNALEHSREGAASPFLYQDPSRQMHEVMRERLKISLASQGGWQMEGSSADALFALRRNEDLKEEARKLFGSNSCAATVRAGLHWLRNQQQADGAFVQLRSITGMPDQWELAGHSAALLAIMGEGVISQEERESVQAGFAWLLQHHNDGVFISEQQPHAERSRGLLVLALVEGAILLEDTELAQLAQVEFLRYGTVADDRYVLAYETARACDLFADIPSAVDAARLLQPMPGTHGFIQRIQGVDDQRALPFVDMPREDSDGRIDPLNWFLESCDRREQSLSQWTTWNKALQRACLLCFRYEGEQAWLPGERMRYGRSGADVLATSLALMNLQVAYRYTPLLSE